MQVTKTVETSPKLQTSVKPSKRKCQHCKRADEDGAVVIGGECMLVCSQCARKLRAEDEQIRREKRIEAVIPPLFKDAQLEHLSGPLQAKIKALSNDKGLLLWGKQGVGKSYAMAGLARHYILTGSTVDRVGYEMLCLKIRDTFKAGSTQGELDVIRPLLEVDKLFVEDVGTTVSAGHQESDFSLRTFLVLLDKRLETCKPTFITTNKSVEQLSKSFDKRIASRLQQACEIIQLTGEDRRAAKSKRGPASDMRAV